MTKGIKGKLILFRHGQTEYNKNKLMTGIADVPLTAEGEEQAREAGRRFAHIPVHAAYSSTLSRAFNTAALALRAAKQVHLENDDGSFRVRQHPGIVELDTGDFTGRCHKTDPEILAWVREFDKPLPGGESAEMALARTQKFFDEEVMPRLLRGETVLVVAHAGIVRVFDFVLGLDQPPVKGAPAEKPHRSIPNATPAVFDFIDGRLVGESLLLGANENKSAAPVKKQNFRK